MKTRTTILTIILMALIISFKPSENPITLDGQIKLNPKDTIAYVGGLIVFAKIGNQTIGQTVADGNGNFHLILKDYNGKRINIFCYGVGMDTLLLYSTQNLDKSNLKLTLFIPIKLKRTIFGKPYCPICDKTDKVYPIIYGLTQVVQPKIVNGDTIYTKIVNHKYYAGTCLNMVARYYCARDKVKF